MKMLYVPTNRVEEFTITNGAGRFIQPIEFTEGFAIWPGTLENPDDAWAHAKLAELEEREMTPLPPLNMGGVK
jgi:hypothetical protein